MTVFGSMTLSRYSAKALVGQIWSHNPTKGLKVLKKSPNLPAL